MIPDMRVDVWGGRREKGKFAKIIEGMRKQKKKRKS